MSDNDRGRLVVFSLFALIAALFVTALLYVDTSSRLDSLEATVTAMEERE